MGEPRQSFDIAGHHLWGRANVGRKVFISDVARLRGDTRHVHIGELAQVHDFAVLLADAPLMIGRAVKIGFGAIIQAHAPIQICAGAIIGNHAQILAGGRFGSGEGFVTGPIVVGTGAIVGPGAVLHPGSTVPEGATIKPCEVFGA